MKEVFTCRLFEKEASRFLTPSEGRILGMGLAREIRLSKTDPLFSKLGIIERTLRNESRFLLSSWGVRRSFSPSEISRAQWFSMSIQRVFEPEGESGGTRYDETSSCQYCGNGSRQISPLALPPRSLPTKFDVAKTIAGEVVVSDRFLKLANTEKIRGLVSATITDPKSAPVSGFRQLVLEPREVSVSPNTEVGETPFNLDNDEARCPLGHNLGLNRIGLLRILESSLSHSDIQFTRQTIGHRIGVLRPEPLIVVSPKFREFVTTNRLTGLQFEVALSE